MTYFRIKNIKLNQHIPIRKSISRIHVNIITIPNITKQFHNITPTTQPIDRKSELEISRIFAHNRHKSAHSLQSRKHLKPSEGPSRKRTRRNIHAHSHVRNVPIEKVLPTPRRAFGVAFYWKSEFYLRPLANFTSGSTHKKQTGIRVRQSGRK